MDQIKPPWDSKSWEVWLRWVSEGARCAYCDLDGYVLNNWRQMDTEHIIPSGCWNKLNLTVACHGCNRMKSNWNPNTEKSGYDPDNDGLSAPDSEEVRQRLIDVARDYVERKWKEGLYSEEIHTQQIAQGRNWHKDECG